MKIGSALGLVCVAISLVATVLALYLAVAAVASLAAAAVCWVVSRATSRRESRADWRWAAELGERGA